VSTKTTGVKVVYKQEMDVVNAAEIGTCIVETVQATTTRTIGCQIGNTIPKNYKAGLLLWKTAFISRPIRSTDEQFAKVITCYKQVASVLG
jgi:hypothetical protein